MQKYKGIVFTDKDGNIINDNNNPDHESAVNGNMTEYDLTHDTAKVRQSQECDASKMRQSQECDTRNSQEWNKTMAIMRAAIPQKMELKRPTMKTIHIKLMDLMMKSIYPSKKNPQKTPTSQSMT